MDPRIATLADKAWDVMLQHGSRVLIALIGAWIALYFLNLAVGFLRRQGTEGKGTGLLALDRKQAQTMATIVHHAGSGIVVFVVVLTILAELGLNPAPILASAGIVGLAVGLGAQSLLKDLIAGVFVLVEDQYRVGDVIRTGAHTGTVEKLTLRGTYLRDADGALHIVPNGDLGRVSNLSSDWGKAVIEINVPYRENLGRCMEALGSIAHQLAAEWPHLIIDKPEVLGVERLGDTSITLKLVAKTAPLEQATVERELRKRIKETFEAQGLALSATAGSLA